MEYLKLITELKLGEEFKDIYVKDGKLYLDNQEVSSTIFEDLKLLHLNELEEELFNRSWFNWPKVFVYNKLLYYRFSLTDLLDNPTILSSEYCNVNTSDCKKYSANLEIDLIDEDQFNNSFLNIMNLSNSNEGIQLYYHLSDLFDLIKQSTTVEIVSDTDTNYTNILNLSKYTRPNSYCNITIKYVKNNETITVDKMFKLSDEACNSLNFFTTIDKTSGCTLEYQDYCIRLFPGANISECVIANCHITYEYK